MKILKIILLCIFLNSNLQANSSYFEQGLIFYNKSELEKAKFKFEQDLVFNPRSEKSYLYLSKIFKRLKKNELEEKNLNSTILLNPKNEEATFNLAELKLKKSNYSESKILVEQLLIICKEYCQRSKKLKIEIEKLIKK